MLLAVIARLFRVLRLLAMTAFFIFGLLSSSFAKGKSDSFFSIASNKDSLLRYSQFEIIDDFNSGALVNSFGNAWEKKVRSPNALELKPEKKDARSKRGHSLKISYQLEPGAQVSLQSSLGRLDISAAKHVVFYCKVEPSEEKKFRGQLWLFLKDHRGQTQSKQITKLCTKKKKWNEVAVALSEFKGLDLNQLKDVQIQVNARKKAMEGNFWIDELSFFGRGDVAFASRKDNLVGFPERVLLKSRKKEILKIKDKHAFLREIARDTWKYFENARDNKNHLAVDHIRLSEPALAADYTSVTNVAMDFLATVAAFDLKFITRDQAIKRIRATLNTMRRMETWKGFFYNFYNTTNLAVTRKFVSSVDSGWFSISLVVVRQAFPELASQATRLLEASDFEDLLDHSNNQLYVGYDVEKEEYSRNHYGMFVSEARATSYMAIGKGDLPKEHWWFLYRTPPKAWIWQKQTPQGEMVTHDGIDYFQGFYTYKDQLFVPSWGGSLFEVLMPTMVIKERELGWQGLGFNNEIATKLHMHYAKVKKKYPVWGLSPASTTNGKGWSYREYGVTDLGVKGYDDQGIITPHVTFLALDTLPEEALKNIRKLLEYDIYGEYGLYDSVDVDSGQVNPQYLALDQGMSLVAIANYVTGGLIQARFHTDPVGKKGEDLLSKESFFNL